jgi:hypothetical protein
MARQSQTMWISGGLYACQVDYDTLDFAVLRMLCCTAVISRLCLRICGSTGLGMGTRFARSYKGSSNKMRAGAVPSLHDLRSADYAAARPSRHSPMVPHNLFQITPADRSHRKRPIADATHAVVEKEIAVPVLLFVAVSAFLVESLWLLYGSPDRGSSRYASIRPRRLSRPAFGYISSTVSGRNACSVTHQVRTIEQGIDDIHCLTPCYFQPLVKRNSLDHCPCTASHMFDGCFLSQVDLLIG